MIRNQMAGLGHAKSLEQGIIPAEFIDMKAAESKYTDALKYERGLVRAVIARKGFQAGITLTKAECTVIQAPTLMIYGNDDPTGSKQMFENFMASLANGRIAFTPDSDICPGTTAPTTSAASQSHTSKQQRRGAHNDAQHVRSVSPG